MPKKKRTFPVSNFNSNVMKRNIVTSHKNPRSICSYCLTLCCIIRILNYVAEVIKHRLSLSFCSDAFEGQQRGLRNIDSETSYVYQKCQFNEKNNGNKIFEKQQKQKGREWETRIYCFLSFPAACVYIILGR